MRDLFSLLPFGISQCAAVLSLFFQTEHLEDGFYS